MAMRTAHDPAVVDVSRAVRASYHFAREAPLIPLFILLAMGLAALFAPALAPYGKLESVPVTDEQCQAKYGRSFRSCYIDDDPPFFMQGSILRTSLGETCARYSLA